MPLIRLSPVNILTLSVPVRLGDIDCEKTYFCKPSITELDKQISAAIELVERCKRVGMQNAERFLVDEYPEDVGAIDGKGHALIMHIAPPAQSLFNLPRVKLSKFDGHREECWKFMK